MLEKRHYIQPLEMKIIASTIKGKHDKCVILAPKAQIRKTLHERVRYPPGIDLANNLCLTTREGNLC